jgi:hypothetical protein
MASYLRKTEIGSAWFWAALVLIAAGGIALLAYITPFGLGLNNDSVGYIGGARNILAGYGYSRLGGNYKPIPVTNFPPMYSVVLAAIGLFGIDPLASSRYLNLVLFGVNIFLCGVVIYRITRSQGFSLAGAALFAISTHVFMAHTWAMSDPIYFMLVFLAFLVFVKYVEDQKWPHLLLLGLLAGMAFVTRYVGVALLATVVFCFLLILPGWRKKLAASAVFLVTALVFPGAWMVRNTLVTSNPVNRQMMYHPIEFEKIKEGLVNFWSWIFPQGFILMRRPTLLGLPAFILLLACMAAAWVYLLALYRRDSHKDIRSRLLLAWLACSHALIYLASFLFTLTFVDGSPIFETRIMLPFTIPVLILTMSLLAWLWTKAGLVVRSGVIAFYLGFTLLLGANARPLLKDLHVAGQGFASEEWSGREVFDAVRQLPKITLYSNKITALVFFTGHPAYIIPSPVNAATDLPNPDYAKNSETIRQSVLDGKAMVVIFDFDTLMKNIEDREIIRKVTDGAPFYRDFGRDVIFGMAP